MNELIGFWLICLAITVFCVSVFDDESTIKEKVTFVIGEMVISTILFVGVFLMTGGYLI